MKRFGSVWEHYDESDEAVRSLAWLVSHNGGAGDVIRHFCLWAHNMFRRVLGLITNVEESWLSSLLG